jgi:hypothetical protein
MVICAIFTLMPTLSPWIFIFHFYTWSNLFTSSKTTSSTSTLPKTITPNSLPNSNERQAKLEQTHICKIICKMWFCISIPFWPPPPPKCFIQYLFATHQKEFQISKIIFLRAFCRTHCRQGINLSPYLIFLLGLGPILLSLHPGVSLSLHYINLTTCTGLGLD